MALPSPNLDDRTFDQLVAEAKARVTASCPTWTDLSPHDPGMVLLELFAHLTETMLYRLNRLPEKIYVELLRLIGVQQQPPSAASTELVFQLDREATSPVVIPRGTRVTTQRSEDGAGPIFATADVARIEVGGRQATVLAFHAEMIEAELLGSGTGLPGLSLVLARPPVVTRTRDLLDLVIGVEAEKAELGLRAPARDHGGKHYRVWREAEGFTDHGDDPHVFVTDRLAGRITFAPALRSTLEGDLAADAQALAAVPSLGKEIRAWYRRGGGPDGNVAAGTLKVLKDAVPGATLTVTNPSPAVGGRAEESLANALARGPEEIHSLRRALTAHDFEALALRSSSGVARARAFTQAQLWSHATPGAVEVTLVPDLPAKDRGPDDRGVSAAKLRGQQTEAARQRIQAELDDRRSLGTSCRVTWARYKTVSVRASVYAHRAEDEAKLKERIEARLYRTICPLPSLPLGGAEPDAGHGWRFGQALRVSTVYDVVLAEPGVSYAEDVKLVVSSVPGPTKAVAVDDAAPGVAYAGSGTGVFRSLDEGEGWEQIADFPGEDVDGLEVHPERPGLVAIASRLPGELGRSKLRISLDSGESWESATHTLDPIEDLAWMTRDGVAVLLLATGVGLFELAMGPEARPLPVVVDPANPKLGLCAVAAATDSRGAAMVAVAATQLRGVFLSTSGARAGSFSSIGLSGEDARVLEVQRDGTRTFLWAGLYASSGEGPGKGALCVELLGTPSQWKPFDRNWGGGSCLALAFAGSTVYAATHRAGVLWCDSSKQGVQWRQPVPDSKLPLRTSDRLFQPVQALASFVRGPLFAGGPAGLFRTRTAEQYEECSREAFERKVTIAPTWLFTSGTHEIEVRQDAKNRD